MKTIITTLFIMLGNLCMAQLNPQGSQYFLNPYLGNPAFAGYQPGLAVDGALSAQITPFDGSPFIQSITVAYGANEAKVGAGLLFYKERAGVINRLVAKATYAYHLPLDYEDSFLDLGLSGGMLTDRIDFKKVEGDQQDQSLYDFNKRGAFIDGDFGLAFRNTFLTVQAAIPNLKRFLNASFKEVSDRYLYMGAVSYHYRTYGATETTISPMLMYRVIQHESNIWDGGLSVSFENGKLTGSGVYHSTGSFTGGIGTLYNNQLSILAQFTSSTSDLKSYSNGQFEIALKYVFKSAQ